MTTEKEDLLELLDDDPERELNNLLLYAEEMCGWTNWNGNGDPRKEKYRKFLRYAIRPLKERISQLEEKLL